MAKLGEYQRKRRFDRTPEPSGEPEPAAGKGQDKSSPAAKRTRLPKPKLPQLEVRPGAEHGDTFVVQKHRATRLHYDRQPEIVVQPRCPVLLNYERVAMLGPGTDLQLWQVRLW